MLVEGVTSRLRYRAEKRDGSGVVSSGSNVKLVIHNITQAKYWTGSIWDTGSVELTATAFASGSWYYELAVPSATAGDVIEWVFYNETDHTVIDDGEDRVFGAQTLLTAETTDVASHGIDDTLEDSSGVKRFTALALAEAPSGGGGGEGLDYDGVVSATTQALQQYLPAPIFQAVVHKATDKHGDQIYEESLLSER